MHTFRRLTAIAFASAAAFTAAPVFAGSNPGGVGNVPGPDYDPANAAPGQCFSRRVTGAGGAYRWDRIECDSAYSQGAYEPWGYGGRVEVETRPGYGYQQAYQGGASGDCGCAGYGGGYRYETPCDPCQAYGGGYPGGYAYGGGYAGDRYGERRYDSRLSQSEYAYDSGYAYGRGDQGVSYPPAYGYGYVAAGRDEAGYLIWPGKTP